MPAAARRRSPAMMLLVPALFMLVATAARACTAEVVAPPPCPAQADIIGSARRLCSGTPTAPALRAVGVLPERSVVATAQVLAKHGFRAAIDLRLLRPGGDEETELMGQLRAEGVSIADRSKVRLLIEEHQVDRPSASQRSGSADPARRTENSRTLAATDANSHSRLGWSRQLQEGRESKGLSMDTVLMPHNLRLHLLAPCAIRNVEYARVIFRFADRNCVVSAHWGGRLPGSILHRPTGRDSGSEGGSRPACE
eukprot:SAG31_NODE_4654_length_3067_cov_2.007075_2_plen_254_part_00